MDETNKTFPTPKSGLREDQNSIKVEDIFDSNQADKLLNSANEANHIFESELQAAFDEFDEDHSGKISKEEFGNFMHKLGYYPTKVELQDLIDEVDKDRIGLIGFHEFKTIMIKTMQDNFTLNSSIEAFAVFDKSMSGKMKKETLVQILTVKDDQNLSQEDIEDLLKNIEFDSNGEINYQDLVKNAFNLFK